jgi:Vacuolar protein sorting-associated protein 62
VHKALASRGKGFWISLLVLAILALVAAALAAIKWGNPFGGSGETPEAVTGPLAGQLARRFAPVLRLAAHESFVPLDRARYLSVADLVEVSTTGSKAIASPSPAALPVRSACGEDCRIFLDLQESPKPGGHHQLRAYERLERRALRAGARPSVYYHVTRYTPSGHYTIQYWFLYLFNRFRFDDHESDWEQSIVRVDEDQHLQEVFYSTHSRGITRARDDVERVGDHPVLYVARGSHANYPSRGRHGTQQVLLGCKAVLHKVACISANGVLVKDRSNGCGDTVAPADVAEAPRSPAKVRLCRSVGGGAASSNVLHYSLLRLGWPAFVGNYGPYATKLFRDPQRRRLEWGSPLEWLESVRGR